MITGGIPEPSHLKITTYLLTTSLFCSISWGEKKDFTPNELPYPVEVWTFPSFEGVQGFGGNSPGNSSKDSSKDKKAWFFFFSFLTESSTSGFWVQSFRRKQENNITNSKQSFLFMMLPFHPWKTPVVFTIISKPSRYLRQWWSSRLVCFPHFQLAQLESE